MRNFVIGEAHWIIETKVFDRAGTGVDKRLITVGEFSLLSEVNADQGKWKIQRMKSGDWSNVLIPDEISKALNKSGMFIRFVRDGDLLKFSVSADGIDYADIRERNGMGTGSDIVQIRNWANSRYENFSLRLGSDITFYGDLKPDGSINIMDLIRMKKYMAKVIIFDDKALKAADINRDGTIGADDMLLLKKYLLGK